jgi:hypothetical protein
MTIDKYMIFLFFMGIFPDFNFFQIHIFILTWKSWPFSPGKMPLRLRNLSGDPIRNRSEGLVDVLALRDEWEMINGIVTIERIIHDAE